MRGEPRAGRVRGDPPAGHPAEQGSLEVVGPRDADAREQQRLDEAERNLSRSLTLLEPKLGASDAFVLETRREYDLVRRAQELRGG